MQLRHCHFAEASNKITSYCDELQSKSGGKGRNQNVKDMDLKSMAKLVRSLPKYQDELRSLNVHVDIASALNKKIDSARLTEFGALEQVGWPLLHALRSSIRLLPHTVFTRTIPAFMVHRCHLLPRLDLTGLLANQNFRTSYLATPTRRSLSPSSRQTS